MGKARKRVASSKAKRIVVSASGKEQTRKAKKLAAKRHGGLHLARRVREIGSGNACPLCGKLVPAMQMLDHKVKIHGETRVVKSPLRRVNENLWVSVLQGGLPSLGKRSR